MAFTSVKQSDSRSIRSISSPFCITNFSVRFNASTSVCRAEDVETDFANPSINMPEEFLHTQATEASLSKALKDRLDLANARAACTTNSAFGSCWRKMKVFLAFQMCHRRAEINSRSALCSGAISFGSHGLRRLARGWEKIMEKRPEAIKEGDDLRWTPLHYVAYLGKVEAVRLLLQHDTSVAYDLDKAGESALHLAAYQGYINVIVELIRSCPDAFDMINTKGQSALHAAVIGGRENVVKYIVGMPNMEDLINEQDNDGNTALHLAALHKKYNIIYILAQDKRVDHLAKNKDHFTALDIFSAHNEVHYKANKVHHLLKGSHGIPGFQGWFIEYGKKRLDKQFVLDRPSVSITTRSNIPNQDNFDLSKKGIMDVQLLVAGLITTVTFAAAFTMPGGYNNDGPDRGMAIFAKRASFKAFVMCNTCSFLCSIIAIILHCESTMFSYRPEPRHIPTVGCCIAVSTVGMMMSYVFGINTVLHRPNERIGESIAPYCAWGVLFTVSLLYDYPDHEAHSWVLGSSPKRYIRRFLFKFGMPLLDFKARLIDWSRGKLMSWTGSSIAHRKFSFLLCQPSISSTFMSAVQCKTCQRPSLG